MKLKFIKLSDRWFLDIPWIGDVNDLQMINGADTILEKLNIENKNVVELLITENKPPYPIMAVLTFKSADSSGVTYTINAVNTQLYDLDKKTAWLCNVTKNLFDTFPKEIFIAI
jgi:hypothetical protein